MKLLIIEDNVELVDSLRDLLGIGLSITNSVTGKEGLALALGGHYDAIILDLGLPDISGLDLCLQLRGAGIKAPILVLSGVSEPATKVALFEAGADDYVTKPFTVGELQARLFALLRRANSGFGQDYLHLLKTGNLTLDPFMRKVERSGKNIKLRRKEFDILEYLMRNRGKIVTRSMIMNNVWEDEDATWDGTINVHIKRLRDQVDRPYKQKLIKTAYGLGYTINEKS